MNKQDLSALVAEILGELGQEPQVKGSDYKPAVPGPRAVPTAVEEGFVEDVTKLDLRKLYLTESPRKREEYARLKARTPARLGSGRAGPRYKTLTMLRFRADHAAAQDAVFTQVSEDFPRQQGLLPLQTQCKNKDEYLTRPDRGRLLDEDSRQKLKTLGSPRVQIVVGDGLSSAAVTENAPNCMAAIRDGLKAAGIETGPGLFVRYCRVGAGDDIGSVTGCELVCMLVGERQGLVTDKSMSAYITYKPRNGIPEASRTVVSNIHAQGTPAVEAGAHIAGLIKTILEKKASGVALRQIEN